MVNRIPPDAFNFYASMGPERSYQAVADEYGVTKRAVTRRAARESWTERLEKIEREARERSDRKLSETLEEVRNRHLLTLKAMHSKALSALRQYPLNSAMEGIRAAGLAIKLERLVFGEATERAEVSVEEVIKKEYELLMEDDEEEEGGDGQGGPS